jgi:hypothetical protein
MANSWPGTIPTKSARRRAAVPIDLAISGGLPQCRLAAIGTTPELPRPTATVIVKWGFTPSRCGSMEYRQVHGPAEMRRIRYIVLAAFSGGLELFPREMQFPVGPADSLFK